MTKPQIIKAILWLGSGILVGYLVWSVAPNYLGTQEDPRAEAYLNRVAAEINQTVPFMIDKETELLRATVAPETLIYNYRLVSFSAAQIDPKKFAAAAKQQVTQGACHRPETRDGYLKKGVTLRYAYYDKDERHIATVDVIPSDCGF